MPRRPATTILLITRQTVVRADFAPGPKPKLLDLWQEPRPDAGDLASAVEATLALGTKVGRQVWILTSDFWVQTLSLPVSKTKALGAVDLAGALNFEAEALSGQSAFESVVGQAFLKAEGADNLYWIVQMRSAERDRLDEVVRAAGGRLAGIGHPAGLPSPLESNAKSWRRFELWQDAVVCLQCNGTKALEVHILNIDPQAGRWQAAAEKVRSGLGPVEHAELLVANGVPTPGATALGTVVSLENESALEGWLTVCAEYLAGNLDRTPMIRPAKRPLSTLQRAVVSVLLMLLVAGACAAHYFLLLEPKVAQLRADLQQAQEPARVLADMEKQSKDLETKQATLQKEERKLYHDNEVLLRQRKRLGELLRFLREQCPQDVVIQKIDSSSGEPHIHGVCLKPELADQFANTLGPCLAANGWEVETSSKKVLYPKIGGAPWQFELKLKEIVAATDTPVEQPVKRRSR